MLFALEFADSQWSYSSRRKFGSAGSWMQLWDWNTVSHNSYSSTNVRLSFGFRQGLSNSFYYTLGSNWQSQLGYNSQSQNAQAFGAEYNTVLVAPYTGVYTFYGNGDDWLAVHGSLYNANTGYGPETQLFNVPSYTLPGDFLTYANINHSPGISLKRGDRYKLRVSIVNNLGPDNMEIAMRVDPSYDPNTGYLVDGLNHASGKDSNLPPEILLQENTVPLTFSPTFLHHHALRDIQIVSVNCLLQREVQVTILY